MLHCDVINISLEGVTIALLCTIMAAVVLQHQKSWRTRLFLTAVALHAGNTTGDLLAWSFTSQANNVAYLLTTVGNFVTYTLAPLAYFAFTLIACAVITGRSRPGSRLAWVLFGVMIALTVIAVALPFINCAVPILYAIDAHNTFTWGPWCTLPDNLAFMQFVLGTVLALIDSPCDHRKLARILILFGVPLVAFATINLTPTLMLAYPSVAIGLLIVYMDMQHVQERELAKRKLEAAVNRNRMLLGQIEPHFIANSLLAIEQLCIENPVTAKNTVQSFVKYLRENFYAMDHEGSVSLEKELEHVHNYLALEQADPESRLEVTFYVDPAVARRPVPALTVQPLVENAVRHGAGSREDGGRVAVRATCGTEGELIVTVTDNGTGFDAAVWEAATTSHARVGSVREGRGIGLTNVRERLALTCGGTLAVSSGPDGTQVTMTVPAPKE